MSDSAPLAVSVVIPVYRSQDIVPHLCKALEQSLAEFRYELILVDDCSPDGSWQAICAAAEANPRIVGVQLRRNVGQDRALMAGLAHARLDYVVIMDDDLQHAPADIPALVEKLVEGYDVCFANFPIKRQTLVKNLGSWLAGKVAQASLGKPPQIYMSPFKALRREVVAEIIKYSGPLPYVDGILLQVTSKLCQLPIEHHARHSGSSSHNLWKQTGVFLSLCTSFSLLPLRVLSVCGWSLAGVSLVAGASLLGLHLGAVWQASPWLALACLMLFIGGLLLAALGLVGEYLGRVLLSVSGLPQYSVLETTPRHDPTPARVTETSEE